MKYLLDTHILIWFLTGDEKLPKEMRTFIENDEHDFYYSVASLLEIELKNIVHPEQMPITGEKFLKLCRRAYFIKLPIEPSHILELKNLQRRADSPPHKDPFDRLLICQAIVENMQLMTHDDRIAEYETPNIYKI